MTHRWMNAKTSEKSAQSKTFSETYSPPRDRIRDGQRAIATLDNRTGRSRIAEAFLLFIYFQWNKKRTQNQITMRICTNTLCQRSSVIHFNPADSWQPATSWQPKMSNPSFSFYSVDWRSQTIDRNHAHRGTEWKGPGERHIVTPSVRLRHSCVPRVD